MPSMTVRFFLPFRPVEREKIQKMLEAARRASCVGNVMNVILDPTRGYRMRVRARDADAEHLVISATRGGVAVPFPGNITLGAEGTFGKATQKITVSMPKSDVLSGVFSFVIRRRADETPAKDLDAAGGKP